MLQSLIFFFSFAFSFSLPPTQCPSKADCWELNNAMMFILRYVIMKSRLSSLNLEVKLLSKTLVSSAFLKDLILLCVGFDK